MRTLLIPESGGDAAVSCIKMLNKCDVSDMRIILCDASEDNIGSQLINSEFIQIPMLKDAYSDATRMIADFLNSLSSEEVIVLPTAEFAPKIFNKDKLIKEIVKENNVKLFIPDYDKWIYSRDKYLLSELPNTVESNLEWSENHIFAKPRFGVGSKGCRKIYSWKESKAISYWECEYVFQEFISGDEYVVDILFEKTLVRKVSKQKAGADVVMEIVEAPILSDMAIEASRFFESDISNVQFIVNGDGEPKIIDIGTRLSGASICGLYAGVNWVKGLLGFDDWYNPEYNVKIIRSWEEYRCIS